MFIVNWKINMDNITTDFSLLSSAFLTHLISYSISGPLSLFS